MKYYKFIFSLHALCAVWIRNEKSVEDPQSHDGGKYFNKLQCSNFTHFVCKGPKVLLPTNNVMGWGAFFQGSDWLIGRFLLSFSVLSSLTYCGKLQGCRLKWEVEKKYPWRTIATIWTKLHGYVPLNRNQTQFKRVYLFKYLPVFTFSQLFPPLSILLVFYWFLSLSLYKRKTRKAIAFPFLNFKNIQPYYYDSSQIINFTSCEGSCSNNNFTLLHISFPSHGILQIYWDYKSYNPQRAHLY